MESKTISERALSVIFRNLLIEPVWNRNVHKTDEYRGSVSTFNRTSMESKRNIGFTSVRLPMRLLIEPVWNRNVDLERMNPKRLEPF